MANLDPQLLAILACPACKGALSLRPHSGGAEELCCDACHLAFPVRGDIPVMLVTEARQLPH